MRCAWVMRPTTSRCLTCCMVGCGWRCFPAVAQAADVVSPHPHGATFPPLVDAILASERQGMAREGLGIDVGGSGFRIGVFNLATGALVGELERHAHGEPPGQRIVLSALETGAGGHQVEWPHRHGFSGPSRMDRPSRPPTSVRLGSALTSKRAWQHFHDGRFVLINDADAVAVAERRTVRATERRHVLTLDHWHRSGHHPSSRRSVGGQPRVRPMASSDTNGVLGRASLGPCPPG